MYDDAEFSSYRKKKNEKLGVASANNSATSTNARQKYILVAIPAYNEEATISGVVLRSRLHADDVVVIDDGSVDNTADMARLAGAMVIHHEENRGYGGAVASCFEAARQFGAEILVILDADDQHNPDEIPALLQEIYVSDADIVVGSRFVNGNAWVKNIPTYRIFGMKILNKITNFTSRGNISDTQSGFRVYSRKAINAINLQSRGMGAGSEILIKAAANDLKIVEVPIITRYDTKNTSSQNAVMHGIDVINAIIRLVAQKRPLFFFGLPGVVSLFFGLLVSLFVLDHYTASNNFVVSYALIAIICSMIGMLSIITALVLWSIQDVKQSTA